MIEADFWRAVEIARAIHDGKPVAGSVTLQMNRMAEALVWITLPPATDEKTVPLTVSKKG